MLIPFPASFDPGSLQQLLDTHLVPPEPVKIEYTFSPRTAVREIHDVEVEMVRARAPESIIPLLPPVSHEEHALGSIHPLCRYPNSTSLCLSSSSVLKYLSIVRPNPRIRLVALFWVLLLPTAADNYAFCLRHTVSHMRVRGGQTVDDYVEEGKYNISHNEMGKLVELDDKVGPTVAILPVVRARAARLPPARRRKRYCRAITTRRVCRGRGLICVYSRG